MKIYSNVITETDVRKAFATAIDSGKDIYIESIRTWTPRAYGYGVEVFAHSVHGKRATGRNQTGYGRGGYAPRAASWTDWGWVIARLYNIDPYARVSFYENEADFVAKVRRYQPRGASLAFLGALNSINEYGGWA